MYVVVLPPAMEQPSSQPPLPPLPLPPGVGEGVGVTVGVGIGEGVGVGATKNSSAPISGVASLVSPSKSTAGRAGAVVYLGNSAIIVKV